MHGTEARLLSNDDQRPHIDYPCTWTYRLIGPSEVGLRTCVAAILGDERYELTVSNASSTGRFISLTLTLTVRDEDQRLAIYHQLTEHPTVRLVL